MPGSTSPRSDATTAAKAAEAAERLALAWLTPPRDNAVTSPINEDRRCLRKNVDPVILQGLQQLRSVKPEIANEQLHV